MLPSTEEAPLTADLHFIAANDDQIANCAEKLRTFIKPQDIVFHASGALPSSIFDELRGFGAFVASVHPVKSFAVVEQAYNSFDGTYCAIEGDEQAVSILSDAFSMLGAKLFSVDSSKKTYYHAATVVACNYLTTIIDFATKIYAEAWLSSNTALEIMEPIVRGTVEKILRSDLPKRCRVQSPAVIVRRCSSSSRVYNPLIMSLGSFI